MSTPSGALPQPRPAYFLNSGDWCRGLVNACKDGAISPGARNLGLSLAVAVNWSPSHGGHPGLYWSVAAALEAIGVSQSTWKRHRRELLDGGFLRHHQGNYLPVVPTKFHRSLTGEQL